MVIREDHTTPDALDWEMAAERALVREVLPPEPAPAVDESRPIVRHWRPSPLRRLVRWLLRRPRPTWKTAPGDITMVMSTLAAPPQGRTGRHRPETVGARLNYGGATREDTGYMTPIRDTLS